MSDQTPEPEPTPPSTASQPPPYRAALGHLQAYVEVSAELLRQADEDLGLLGVSPTNILRQRITRCLAGDFPWQAAMPRPTPRAPRRGRRNPQK